MTRSRFKGKVRASLIIFIALIVTIGFWLYYRSSLLKRQGDDLIRYGKAREAIEVYKKAQRTFPLRRDIARDIEGAKLILATNREYGRIADIVGEFQEVPPLSNLPTTPLNPNELFVPVLMYHHIRVNPKPNDSISAALNVTPEQLDQQLSYLSSRNYHAVTLDELADALDGKTSLPSNPVILTFDDGYRNFYENAFPLLKKYNMKATEFVITRFVDVTDYLTWDQIKEMDKSGLVVIGAHTRHHPNLPELSQAAIIDEVRGSKMDLEDHLKKTVNWFAYPYGSYSAFIMQAVRDAGFRGAASTVYGAIQNKDSLYLFPRIMVDGRFSLDNIARRIQR